MGWSPTAAPERLSVPPTGRNWPTGWTVIVGGTSTERVAQSLVTLPARLVATTEYTPTSLVLTLAIE